MLSMNKQEIKDKAAGFLGTVWENKDKVLYGISIVSLLAISFMCGGQACKKYNANRVEVPKVVTEVKEVKIPVESQKESVIQYVQKETPNDADVEIRSDKPQVVINYNGKETAFDTLDNETQKFDKGKLKVEQSSKTTLDVTPIVEREVQTAVEQNTKTLTEQKDKEVQQVKKDEAKKRHKKTFESFLIGAGIGLVGGVMIP